MIRIFVRSCSAKNSGAPNYQPALLPEVNELTPSAALRIEHEPRKGRPAFPRNAPLRHLRPIDLLAVLKNHAYHFKRIGLEAGPLSQWLASALAEAELPVVCVEPRHARGIAQMMRVMLYEAAQSMLHSKKWSWLKAWAMQIARRRVVALARRLAVIMHRIWVDGTVFRWTREQAAAAA